MVTRCAVFDFDGTLVQSVQIKHDAFYAAAAGIPGAAAELKLILDDPAAGDRYKIFANLAARLGNTGGADPRALAARYTTICFDKISVCPEVPGAQECLRTLKRRGVRLFLHSRTPIDALQSLVQARRLARYFDAVWGAPMHRAEALRLALADVGCPPGEAVLVSDDGFDVSIAAQAGTHFVGVASGSAAPAEFASHHVIRALDHLPNLLQQASIGPSSTC